MILTSVGKICVPIDSKKPDEFKVEEVPTLTQVINELGTLQTHAKEEGDSVTPHCLEPYMATYRSFLKSCDARRIKEIQAANKAKGADSMEF
jgi:hypothetical protein